MFFVFYSSWPFRFSCSSFSARGGGFYRLYALAASPLVLYGIYLTNSRGGFLSLLAVFLLHFKSRFKSFLGVFLGVALVGTLIVFRPSRFGDFNDEDKSASHRVDMWIEGLEMLRYNPVFGIGKGKFANYTGSLIAHDSFLEVAGETGLVGLFFWLSLIYVSLKGLLAAKSKTVEGSKEDSLVTGLLICIVGYLFTALFITCEFELFYVFLGLSIVAARLKGVTVDFRLQDVSKVLGIQAAAVMMFWVITKVYPVLF